MSRPLRFEGRGTGDASHAFVFALGGILALGCASGPTPASVPPPADSLADEAAAERAGAAGEPDMAGGPATAAATAAAATPGRPAPTIARVTLRLDPVSPRVGDTVRVDAAALGTSDEALEGFEFQLRAPRRLLAVPAGGRALVALREGTAIVTAHPAVDGVPVGGADPARVEVTIRPAPLTGLDIEAPETLYAGTRALAEARARTAYGPREAVPQITWRSDDASVLAVTSIGGLIAGRPGTTRLEAIAEEVRAATTVRVVPNPVRALELSPAAADVAVGEVVHLSIRALDADRREVGDAPVEWAVSSVDGDPEASAVVGADGAFVANTAGKFRVVGVVGDLAAVSEIHARPRPARRPVTLVGHGPVPAGAGSTTDLWVFEGVDGRDYAYTGTLTAATMYAWDVTNPAAPVLADSVRLDGRRVNDVKIDGDATIAVVTSEGASDRRNGITILDILDPAHPRPLAHFTENLTGGVHNVWIEGDLVYAVHNGTRDLHIVDISTPEEPRHVGRWGLEAEGRVLHDVMVKDGLAYLSYWDDGLVILDVGAGIAGGTPTEPAFVSRHVYSYPLGKEIYGNTHHAIRYRNWVFAADEIFGCSECTNGPRGYVHVIDVADIENPVEVAFYRVPEAGAHNLWVEDDLMYVAYYQAGVRVVDVSGELRGDLWRQGREVGWYMTESPDGEVPNAAMAWGPQPHKGLLYVSDLNSGLWVLRPETESRDLLP